MPSPTLTDLMDEMATMLEDAFATNDIPIQVVPRLNFNPTPPSIDIYPADPFRAKTSAGFGEESGEVIFTIRARVSTADNEAGQELLLSLMDEEQEPSLAETLMDDQTLNGLAASVDVDGPSGYAQYGDSGGQGALLGCEWKVTVLRAYS